MPDIKFGTIEGNSSFSSNSPLKSLQTLGITPARVTDIILDDSHPKFKEYGEWSSIGLIFFNTNLLSPNPQNSSTASPTDKNTSPVAYPLYANIKNYPLINEIIYILYLPSNELLENPLQRIPYYLPSINIWNSQHHNGIPAVGQTNNQSVINDYKEAENGSYSRKVTDDSTDIYLGKTFQERLGLHPLLSYEGDIIYEGRWGNSIRLGSTVKDTVKPNSWSELGNNGDPIIIIRNGQTDYNNDPWIPEVEQINSDKSSIYLTSTQKLPLSTKSNITDSFNKIPNSTPTNTSQYDGNQIVLNSGRLVFNAKSDSIILSSEKSIHLSSNDSIGIDGAKQIILSSQKVYLGSSIGVEGTDIQSVVLGENLNQVLQNISTFLNTLGIAFSTATDSMGVPIVALNSISQDAQTLSKNLSKVINSKDLLSKRVKTI